MLIASSHSLTDQDHDASLSLFTLALSVFPCPSLSFLSFQSLLFFLLPFSLLLFFLCTCVSLLFFPSSPQPLGPMNSSESSIEINLPLYPLIWLELAHFPNTEITYHQFLGFNIKMKASNVLKVI